MEVTKIELSVENRGKNKKYDYIAGCLIAYACLITMKADDRDLGIFYTRATKSIYIEKYGMIPYDNYYVKSSKGNSKRLIDKYLSIVQ